MKKLLLVLLLIGCTRDPKVIGTIVTEQVNTCVSNSHYYDSVSKSTKSRCGEYKCQQYTKKLGKRFYNDETLNIQDLYSGRCK